MKRVINFTPTETQTNRENYFSPNRNSNGNERKDKLYELLTNNGFIKVVEDALCLDKNHLFYNLLRE
jgi:hypothetical protein